MGKSNPKSKMQGWIRLHRQLLDSQVFANEKALKTWIWLMLKARHKDGFIPITIGRGGTIIELKRGQLLFGRFTAEEALGINGSTIYKWIQKFKEWEMIEIKSNSHSTIITICNYDYYNPPEVNKVTTDEQPLNSHSTATQQPSNTNNNDNNDDNDDNDDNDRMSNFEFFWNSYDKKVGRAKSMKLWQQLSHKDQEAIISYLPEYIKSKPDKQYRKNPETFLRNRTWEDEIIHSPENMDDYLEQNQKLKLPELPKAI